MSDLYWLQSGKASRESTNANRPRPGWSDDLGDAYQGAGIGRHGGQMELSTIRARDDLEWGP